MLCCKRWILVPQKEETSMLVFVGWNEITASVVNWMILRSDESRLVYIIYITLYITNITTPIHLVGRRFFGNSIVLEKWLDIDFETSTLRDTNKLELISWKKTAGFINQICVKGGPEPIEKESHEFLGSKRDDQFSNPFFEMVPKTC